MPQKLVRKSNIPSSAQKVFSGVIFSVYQWQAELYDGSTDTFECIARPDTAGVLAVTQDKQIIITRQEQPHMDPFYSLVGGVCDPGETPLQTAQREAREEVGIISATWEEWFSVRLSQKLDWNIHQFVARDCKLGAELQHDAGEKIEIELVSWERFVELIKQDDFRDQAVALKLLRQIHEDKSEVKIRKWLLGE